jgi:hypothetical protein
MMVVWGKIRPWLVAQVVAVRYYLLHVARRAVPGWTSRAAPC